MPYGGPMTQRGASIRDVAKMAGVSHQTVSRVLNAPETVGPVTRAAVQRAIEMLGYHPNVAARALKTKRSRVVGVLVMPNSLFVAQDGLNRLGAVLRARGLHVLVAGTQGPTYEDMRRSVEPLLAYGVDALVIAANEQSAGALAGELARSLAVVALQPGIDPADGVSSVHVDLVEGIRAVVDHLVDRGDRVLDMVSGPPGMSTVRLRLDGWARALPHHQLTARTVPSFPMTASGGYDAAHALAATGLPDAVLACNEWQGLGIVRAFHELGIRIPEDVAVVGIDDLMVVEHSIPSLTTLRQPYVRVSDIAAQLLLASLDGREPRCVRVAPALILRESTAGRRGGASTAAPR